MALKRLSTELKNPKSDWGLSQFGWTERPRKFRPPDREVEPRQLGFAGAALTRQDAQRRPLGRLERRVKGIQKPLRENDSRELALLVDLREPGSLHDLRVAATLVPIQIGNADDLDPSFALLGSFARAKAFDLGLHHFDLAEHGVASAFGRVAKIACSSSSPALSTYLVFSARRTLISRSAFSSRALLIDCSSRA